MADVFISYHSGSSRNIVEAIVNKLETNGIRCWYAPRDVEGSYAGSITAAVNSCSVFVLVLNKAASESPHVLTELELITDRLTSKEAVSIIPFHVADEEISDDVKYYIRRMHWIDAMTPPLEESIDALARRVKQELNNDGIDKFDIAPKQTTKTIEKPDDKHPVFISYHTDSSRSIVETIVNKLESNGIRCWYAPRDVEGSYAGSITAAVKSCSVFVLVLNKAASESPHILNELEMVSWRISKNESVRVIPLRVTDEDISDDAKYYIGRLHWIDAAGKSAEEQADSLLAALYM